MLEIGGGEGLFSLWALAHGMEKVMILEPEADGSTHGVGERFLKHRNALNISEERLSYFPQTFQEYEGENRTFDLVLSYNSINHLDERACKLLNRSKSSKIAYLKLLEKVFSLMRPRGILLSVTRGDLTFGVCLV
jgi:SAM-dependent methyltransferase